MPSCHYKLRGQHPVLFSPSMRHRILISKFPICLLMSPEEMTAWDRTASLAASVGAADKPMAHRSTRHSIISQASMLDFLARPLKAAEHVNSQRQIKNAQEAWLRSVIYLLMSIHCWENSFLETTGTLGQPDSQLFHKPTFWIWSCNTVES